MNSEEKNTAIEQIAAAIAHEVKNPITLVRANIDLLQSKDHFKENGMRYELIKKELDKINDIMMDFITLTKPAAEENDLLYIYDIFRDLMNSYIVTHGHKIEFSLLCSNKDFTVLGNEKNLKILFHNLLKNAIESIDKDGSITIQIDEKDGYIVSEIADTGAGIKEDIKENVFSDFFTTKTAGSGLGLAICKKITAEHNGLISFYDNKPKGTVFCVKLPFYNDFE